MSTGWDSDYRYEPAPLFKGVFRCLPFDQYKKPALETGNKIVMPQSCIHQLHELGVRHPWFFKIEGYRGSKVSHCGVLEFDAEEGCVYMPRWMMANLSIEEGDDVIVRDAALSRGTYMKLQPHEAAFVELSDPRAVLETAMRGFSCLSSGDTIAVRHRGRDYCLDVLEVGPGGPGAVSLIDTDCCLDFAPPLDYKEPVDVEDHEVEELMKTFTTFTPFMGAARRLDGTAATVAAVCSGGKKKKQNEEKESFKPFSGKGRIIGSSFFDS